MKTEGRGEEGRMQTATQQEALEGGTVPDRTRKGTFIRRPGTDEREAVVAMLRNQGLETRAIADTLGIAVASVYNIEHRIRKNGKIPLLSSKRIKKATRAIDAFIEGKPVGGEVDPITGKVMGGITPKCSTVLAAANVVLDRAYPKAQDDPGRGNVSFTQVNISLASGMAPNPPITVDAESVALPNENKGQ